MKIPVVFEPGSHCVNECDFVGAKSVVIVLLLAFKRPGRLSSRLFCWHWIYDLLQEQQATEPTGLPP